MVRISQVCPKYTNDGARVCACVLVCLCMHAGRSLAEAICDVLREGLVLRTLRLRCMSLSREDPTPPRRVGRGIRARVGARAGRPRGRPLGGHRRYCIEAIARAGRCRGWAPVSPLARPLRQRPQGCRGRRHHLPKSTGGLHEGHRSGGVLGQGPGRAEFGALMICSRLMCSTNAASPRRRPIVSLARGGRHESCATLARQHPLPLEAGAHQRPWPAADPASEQRGQQGQSSCS